MLEEAVLGSGDTKSKDAKAGKLRGGQGTNEDTEAAGGVGAGGGTRNVGRDSAGFYEHWETTADFRAILCPESFQKGHSEKGVEGGAKVFQD